MTQCAMWTDAQARDKCLMMHCLKGDLYHAIGPLLVDSRTPRMPANGLAKMLVPL